MGYEEIAERTIPQIEALLARLGKHIGLKAGVLMDEKDSESAEPMEEHSTDDAMAFVAMFS